MKNTNTYSTRKKNHSRSRTHTDYHGHASGYFSIWSIAFLLSHCFYQSFHVPWICSLIHASWHMSWLVHRHCTYALDIYNELPMRPPHGGPSAHYLRDLHCLHYKHCFPGLPHKPLHRRPRYRHSCACSLYRLPAELMPVSGATQLRRWWVRLYPNLCSKVKAAHYNLVKFC